MEKGHVTIAISLHSLTLDVHSSLFKASKHKYLTSTSSQAKLSLFKKKCHDSHGKERSRSLSASMEIVPLGDGAITWNFLSIVAEMIHFALET